MWCPYWHTHSSKLSKDLFLHNWVKCHRRVHFRNMVKALRFTKKPQWILFLMSQWSCDIFQGQTFTLIIWNKGTESFIQLINIDSLVQKRSINQQLLHGQFSHLPLLPTKGRGKVEHVSVGNDLGFYIDGHSHWAANSPWQLCLDQCYWRGVCSAWVFITCCLITVWCISEDAIVC